MNGNNSIGNACYAGYEFYWPNTETSAVGVPSLRRFLLKCNCSILLLTLANSLHIRGRCITSVSSWQCLSSMCRYSRWISSRRPRSCGVLFVNLSQQGFPATCWIHRCWVCCSVLFTWDIGWWLTDRKHCYNSQMKKPVFMNKTQSFVFDGNRLPRKP